MDQILPMKATKDMDVRSLREIVAQGVGAASVCWENMSGTGVFQSDRALELVREIMAAVEQHVDYQIQERDKAQKEKATHGNQ